MAICLNWIFPIKEVAWKGDSSGVWRNILLANVLLSTEFISILIDCYWEASALVRGRVVHLTRLSWWVEAVDLLRNGLNLRVA